MKLLQRFLRYTAILIPILITQLTASIVGTTKGEFSVNQGVAHYKLKIDVPPGVAGTKPDLWLEYSSNADNGYMGVGWRIGGGSTITRCPQTKAVDGVNHKFGVKYNSNDRFCLDGKRLIVVKGSYGADGSEYRTEIDTYSKITQKGYYLGGPSWFEVKTKSGLTYRYGLYGGNNGDASSYITINGPKAFWKVSDITDTYGNRVTFHYKNSYSNGENYLDKVTYADNIVDFIYEDRADKKYLYSGGHQINMTKRLKEVIVKTGSKEIRRYKIRYSNESRGSKRSYLISITEHVPEGDLKTLYFGYDSAGNLSFHSPSFWVASFGYNSSGGGWRKSTPRHIVDINGDGLADIVGFASTGVYVSINNGKKFSTDTRWIASFGTEAGGWEVEKHPRHIVDVNGDGLPDIVGFGGSGVYVALNTGHNFSSAGMWVHSFGYNSDGGGWGKNNPRQVIDINGDGLADIVGFANDGVYVSLNNGHGFSSPNRWIASFGYNAGGWEAEKHPRQLVDVNGDGLPDIVGFGGSGVYVALNTGHNFTSAGMWVHSFGYNSDGGGWRIQDHPRQIVDVNGDGLPDIVGFASAGVYVSINTGRSFLTPSMWISSFGYDDGWRVKEHIRQVVDVNGDGLADIVGFGYSGVYVSLNTGHNFSSPTLWVSSYGYDVGGWEVEKHPRHIVDVNGDGLADIVGFGGSGTYVSLNNSNHSEPQKI